MASSGNIMSGNRYYKLMENGEFDTDSLEDAGVGGSSNDKEEHVGSLDNPQIESDDPRCLAFNEMSQMEVIAIEGPTAGETKSSP